MWRYPEEFFALSTANETKNQILFWDNKVASMLEPTITQSIFDARDPDGEEPVLIATASRSSSSGDTLSLLLLLSLY